VSLNWISQDDFAAGILRNVARDIDVGVGVSNAVNGLFYDDGDCYLRGNTRQYVAPIGAPLTFLWTGDLGGSVGLASTAAKLYSLQGNTLTALVGGTPLTRPVKPAIVAGELFLPNGTSWKGVGTQPQTGQLPAALPGASGPVHLAAAGGRLVIGQGRFVRFSASGNPRLFDPTDFHELPEGAQIRGLATIKSTLLVFTGYGIWAIENLDLDLTDDAGNPQQVMQKLIPELGLLHESGLVEWSGRIIAPCGSRIMLIDTVSAPVSISDSIPPLYSQHVLAGDLPGGAKVYRNHLFLPWLNAAGVPLSTLVCRLNRPVNARATYYPFSIFTGHAASMVMGDMASVTNAPTMLAAHADGRIVDYQGIFDPDAQHAADADGTTPEFDLETRDFPTGNGQPNHLRALRLSYTLQPLAGGTPAVDAAFSYGSVAQNYEQLRSAAADYTAMKSMYVTYTAALRGSLDPAVWGSNPYADDPARYWVPLEGHALESDGVEPEQWILTQPKRVRYARARFRCTDPVAKLIVHRVGLGVRPATHQR
jgi:hypothetical protein